jgi:hypothetical protein
MSYWPIFAERSAMLILTHNNDKAQRLSWFGHMHRMANDRMATKLYEHRLVSSRLAGRPKIRWENDIKEDFIFQNLVGNFFLISQFVVYSFSQACKIVMIA